MESQPIVPERAPAAPDDPAMAPVIGLRHLSKWVRLVREPVPAEKQRLMRATWEALDPRWRTAGQGLGRQATGCGATIGVHPACDFACTGCYLGAGANHAGRTPLDETFRQLDRL